MHNHDSDSSPKVINTLVNGYNRENVFEIAEANKDKIVEFKRILNNINVVAKDIALQEINTLNPYQAVEAKAVSAWKANDNNPILVEDTSLEIYALGKRPGTLVHEFTDDIELRMTICEKWLNSKDRRAVARVILAIYDGNQVHKFEASTSGIISNELVGTNGFGWDDMFIPDGQPLELNKTFAQMQAHEKDKYSMRYKELTNYLQNPIELKQAIYMIPEPYPQEIKRVNLDKLTNKRAREFAYQLECLEGNQVSEDLQAPNYKPIEKEENIYFSRFSVNSNSKSLGIVFTDVDRSKVENHSYVEKIIN